MSEFIFFTRKLCFLIQKNTVIFLANILVTVVLYYVFSNTTSFYERFFASKIQKESPIYFTVLVDREDPLKIQEIEKKIKNLPIILELSKMKVETDEYYQNILPEENISILKYQILFRESISFKTKNLLKRWIEKLYTNNKHKIGEVFFAKDAQNPLFEKVTELISLSEKNFYYACSFLLLFLFGLWVASYYAIIQKTLYVQFLCENIIGIKNVFLKLLSFYNILLVAFVTPFIYTFQWTYVQYLFLLGFLFLVHVELMLFSSKRLYGG